MDIVFKSKRLAKTFNEEKVLLKCYGKVRTKKIKIRMAALRAASSLAVFLPAKTKPERCHELIGKDIGIFSVDLEQPYRLLFTPISDCEDELKDEDGNYIWKEITSIKILEIRDTHDK